jgi:hypothetical protein
MKIKNKKSFEILGSSVIACTYLALALNKDIISQLSILFSFVSLIAGALILNKVMKIK